MIFVITRPLRVRLGGLEHESDYTMVVQAIARPRGGSIRPSQVMPALNIEWGGSSIMLALRVANEITLSVGVCL
jgi:hypothetical protein